MDVFISWSGDKSRAIAEALRKWLKQVVNAVDPWMSLQDVNKGARWSSDVATKLAASKVGIICVPPSNLNSNWLLFEAGALSKTLENTHVGPLLVDLNPSDVSGPLAQFQATRVAKDDIKKLLRTINSALGDTALSESHIDEAFEVWWPKLEEQIERLPPEADSPRTRRAPEEMPDEILERVRGLERNAVPPLDGVRNRPGLQRPPIASSKGNCPSKADAKGVRWRRRRAKQRRRGKYFLGTRPQGWTAAYRGL